MPDGKVVYKILGDNSEYQKTINSTEGIASKAGKVIAGAITGATVAAGGFAAAAVGVGANFDKSMSQVAATMGKTVDEIGDLREFAQEMGASTAFSATEAADALNYMALAGYDAETSMAMLPNVLNLAAAGDMQLARASDMVTDASSALGLSIEETSELVDKMAQASSKSNTSVSQLGDAILTVGGTAKNLAGGTTELSTALGILADNGIKGSEGGTALRNIILAMTPTTKDAIEAFERLGLESYDADGNLRPLADTFRDLSDRLSQMTGEDRTRILNDIFNKVDLKSVNALLGASGDRISEIYTRLGESGVAWEKYGEDLAEVEERQADWVALAMQMIDAGWDADEAAAAMAHDYGIATDDAMVLLHTVDDVVKESTDRWDELSGSIDEASGAAQKMANTQLDNLAGDVTLLKSAFEGAQIQVADKLMPSLREFVGFGTYAITTVATAFQEQGVDGAAKAFGAVLTVGMNKIIEELPTFVNAGFELLSAIVEGLMNNLPALLNAALEIIVTLANNIAEDLPQMIPTIVRIMLTIVDTLIANIDKLVDASLKLIIALAVGLIEALPELIKKAPEIIISLVNALIENVPKVVQAGKDILKSLLDAIEGMIKDFFDIGSRILDGLKDGIISKATALKDSVVDAVSGAWGAAKRFLGISSPSKLFMEMGGFIDEGLAEGIEGKDDLPASALSNMVSNLVPMFDAAFAAPSVTNQTIINNTPQSVASGSNSAVMMLNGRVFGELVYDFNGGEDSRIGVVYGS